MQKKEIVLTLELLAEKGVSEELLEFFKENYPNDSASLSEVFRKLQELANTTTDYLVYVCYAKWLLPYFPPTQEPLALNELTEKVIIHNGDVTIKKGVKGERFIIGNGELNMKGGANLYGAAEIWAENVIAKNKTIALDDFAHIWAKKTIDAEKIKAKCCAHIWAKKINVQKITDDTKWRIHGDINIIQPSSNPLNVTQPAD